MFPTITSISVSSIQQGNYEEYF